MPIEIKGRESPKEKEVTFKIGEGGIVTRLYGSLDHNRKEIDEIVRMEKWDL